MSHFQKPWINVLFDGLLFFAFMLTYDWLFRAEHLNFVAAAIAGLAYALLALAGRWFMTRSDSKPSVRQR